MDLSRTSAPTGLKSLVRLASGTLLALLPACNSASADSLPDKPATRPAWVRPAPEKNHQIDLKQTLGYLAGDELEGRGVGTVGLEKAGEYIADHVNRAPGPKAVALPLNGLDNYFKEGSQWHGVDVTPLLDAIRTTLDAGIEVVYQGLRLTPA